MKLSDKFWDYRKALGAIWDGTYVVYETPSAGTQWRPVAVGLTEEDARHVCELHNAAMRFVRQLEMQAEDMLKEAKG